MGSGKDLTDVQLNIVKDCLIDVGFAMWQYSGLDNCIYENGKPLATVPDDNHATFICVVKHYLPAILDELARRRTEEKLGLR